MESIAVCVQAREGRGISLEVYMENRVKARGSSWKALEVHAGTTGSVE